MHVPTQSQEVMVSDVNRLFVKQWISGYSKNKPSKCLLLLGPSGVGKSTLAELCLRESSYTIINVAGDTYRNKRTVERDVRDALRLPIKQAFVVEDPHVMVADGGLQSLLGLRGTRIPVVIICAATKKCRIQQVLAHADKVIFNPLQPHVLAKRFGLSSDDCRGGDLRQICLRQAGGFTQSERDEALEIQEAGYCLLEGQPVTEGLRMYRVDCQALGSIVHANFTDLVKSIEVAADVAHDMSTADIMGGGEMADDLSGIVGTVTAGNRIRKRPTRPRPDLLWTKSAMRQTRLRGIVGSTNAFAEVHNTLDIWSLPVVRDAMLAAASAGDMEAVMKWAPNGTLPNITNVMRIGYTKNDAIINRFRRTMKSAACRKHK